VDKSPRLDSLGHRSQRPTSQEQWSVGVVVPTTGRPSLPAAVASVLAQSVAPAQVVVAVDGPLDLLAGVRLPEDARIRVVAAPHGPGPGAVRQLGVRSLDTELLALLDDDDQWVPRKLELQLQAYSQLRAMGYLYPVVACRTLKIYGGSARASLSPLELILPGQRPAEYLFRRRRIRPYGAALGSSMILCARELADLVPFDLPGDPHEDWDWVLRAREQVGAAFQHIPEVGVVYSVTSGSLSRITSWRHSVTWALRRGRYLAPREQADFLLTISAPLALAEGDWRGLGQVVALAATRGPGGLPAWSFITLMVLRRLATNLVRR
jgi:glycosyltransferase involved in cell wall biosynthesis